MPSSTCPALGPLSACELFPELTHIDRVITSGVDVGSLGLEPGDETGAWVTPFDSWEEACLIQSRIQASRRAQPTAARTASQAPTTAVLTGVPMAVLTGVLMAVLMAVLTGVLTGVPMAASNNRAAEFELNH